MHELGHRYDHLKTEEKIYRLWEESGYFNPDKLPSSHYSLSAKPYCIIMPPNNANGLLHMGHAVGLTLQDILIRFWRMRGRRTLWLPGADHAGFETQVVFDKKLDKEGRDRREMSREQIYKEIWDFTQENKVKMYAQTKKLGASCDWSRETFTLDPKIVKGVYATFKKLYDDGLAYRDLRVVNWCPKHKTALSDLEVKYVEREDPLYFIKYGPLTLATVRPETKFGDTALAVNPKDKRYQKYIGKEIEAQGVLGPLKFRVVGDEAVDPEFGTGVVKVTPAHDATDFEIWQRHKNEIPGPKVVIDENGRLTGEVGEYKGLKVAEAREKVAEAMKKIGILEKVDLHYKHQIATCYKCGNTLEPLPKPQWFIKVQPLAKKALEAVQKGKIKIIPDHQKKVYLHWLKNIRDWNISRQIVWGIRIPAWFCLSCGEPKINAEIKAKWFLIRHGETDWNREKRFMSHSPIPLNDLGRKQSQKAAEILKGHKIDIIISSDIKRCAETAEIIAQETGAKIIFEKNFRERNLGVLEGMTRDEALEKFGADSITSYEEKVPEAENLKEVENRVWAAFKNHKIDYGNKNIVIVSHGGVIRMINKKLKNLGFEETFGHPGVENAEIIQVEICDKCKKCGADVYEQDPDVFDTWFSSGQWPLLTLGFEGSEKSKVIGQRSKVDRSDFESFYPTDVMETAYDIIFFWVTRMVMLGLYRTGKIPFKTVYFHGIVRDKDKQKMSKSKGNVVDPLGVAETYGTDAVRMALVVGNTPGNDIVISEDKIRGYRNFATKIWNMSRFILMNRKPEHEKVKYSPTTLDKKNLAELKKIKAKVAKHIEKLEFHLAAERVYHYIWHTFADKIIESYKKRLNNGEVSPFGAATKPSGHGSPRSGESEAESPAKILAGNLSGSQKEKLLQDAQTAYQTLETILTESLSMLHPFMPYVTEEIYQKFRPGELLMIKQWS